MIVTKKEYKQRLDICYSCEKLVIKTKQCSICNCIMPVKALMRYNIKGDHVKCPHPDGNKWLLNGENKIKNSSSTVSEGS